MQYIIFLIVLSNFVQFCGTDRVLEYVMSHINLSVSTTQPPALPSLLKHHLDKLGPMNHDLRPQVCKLQASHFGF